MIPRIPIHASAIRTFHGYRRVGLAEPDFSREVRNVFIPGTPLMLRDLGLAAYIPVLLPDAPATVDLPDEAALIAYPSRARYTHARQNSILGQLYTHTHLFVFDTSRSDGAFPEPLLSAAMVGHAGARSRQAG